MTTAKRLQDRNRAHQSTGKHKRNSPETRDQAIPRPVEALIKHARKQADDPQSGITMCHRQGKTAVYLSQDRRYIVEHPPHGPVKQTLRKPAGSRSPGR